MRSHGKVFHTPQLGNNKLSDLAAPCVLVSVITSVIRVVADPKVKAIVARTEDINNSETMHARLSTGIIFGDGKRGVLKIVPNGLIDPS